MFSEGLTASWPLHAFLFGHHGLDGTTGGCWRRGRCTPIPGRREGKYSKPLFLFVVVVLEEPLVECYLLRKTAFGGNGGVDDGVGDGRSVTRQSLSIYLTELLYRGLLAGWLEFVLGERTFGVRLEDRVEGSLNR